MKFSQYIFALLAVIIAAHLNASHTAFAQSANNSQCNCSPIEKPSEGRSGLYLEFMRVDEEQGERKVVLRLVNNTTCIVQAEGNSYGQLALPRGGRAHLIVNHGRGAELEDGTFLWLNFYTQDSRHQSEPKPYYERGDYLDAASIGAGRSVIFKVPLSIFKKKSDLIVPVKLGNYGLEFERRLYFTPGDLPEEMLKQKK